MRELLRSVWDEPRPADPPRRGWRDWLLVGVLAPLAVLEGVLRPELPARTGWLVITVALLPTLLWRRTRPLLMLVIGFGTGLVPELFGYPPSDLYTMAYLLILPFALARWGSGREILAGLLVMPANLAVSALAGQLRAGDAIGGAAVLLSCLALGAALRFRSRARLRELDQVKLVERERLARELHDTVAHHVSAMAIRAQAGLAVAGSEPGPATDALRVIEAEASRALDEMRTMVRVLRRDQPAELAPSPRIADLDQLATRGRPCVEVVVSGDIDDIAPAVGAAIYRLAQESVTNARRHARHATRVEVRVTADESSVRLRVSDDGELSPGRPGSAPGYGLIGMIERAQLLGGTCQAGPEAGRGWTVTAVLPRTGSPG